MRDQIYRRLLSIAKSHSRAGLYEFLDAEFDRIRPGSRVLTIGGDGIVTEKLRDYAESHHFSVTTVDIDANRGPDLVADFCDDRCLPEMQFDCLILSEVLEHFHNPVTAIANCERLLAKSGTLLLTTPFIFPIHERPVDHFRYTKYGLMHLLSGFKAVSIKERNSWLEACLILPARVFLERGAFCRAIGATFIIFNCLGIPLARTLAKYCRTDVMTTGYNVKAVRA